MSMIKRLRDTMGTVDTPTNPIRGRWFNILLCPDLVTDERLNIGVGFVHDGENTVYKQVIKEGNYRGLLCLYQDRISKANIDFMIRLANEITPQSWPHQQAIPSPNPHIYFSDFKPAFGQSIENILNGFFKYTVTLARLPPTEDVKPYAGWDAMAAISESCETVIVDRG